MSEDTPIIDNGMKSRKFVFSVLIAITATALVANAMIDPGTYSNIMNVTILTYVGGNVAEKYATKRS